MFITEWNARRGKIISNPKPERKDAIQKIREHVRCDIERLQRIIQKFEQEISEYSAGDIIDEYNRYISEQTLFAYMSRIIDRLKLHDKIRTAETYAAALNSFRKFRNGADLVLDTLNCDIVKDYEIWLKKCGLTPNTISFYNRILRAAYNRAVQANIIHDRQPFRDVYTGVDKTVKRALPLSEIKKISALDLHLRPSLDFARDMFIMSFMLRGMSFIDMAFLKKTDLKDGYVTYRRKKTGQTLSIEWTPEMQAILNKYPPNESVYLLPIIKHIDINERAAYRNVGYNINHNLKTIAQRLCLHVPLTLYVARHSWASIARAKGIPLSVISEGMGHESEHTTLIYLASLDSTSIDNANRLILDSLL